MLTALIMAGGKGTRFWPLSTEEKPKQFLNLIGNETMIQMTVNRIKPIISMDKIFVCTCKMYVDLVKEQLPELPDRNIIVEPEGKNTAPCIALSALIIERYYKGASMIVLPADHLIQNEEKFREIVSVGQKFVERNKTAILTLGMTPDRPETGYGYIKYGEQQVLINNEKVIKVDTFVEKPSKERARQYLEEGCYLWNGGIFMWTIDNILEQLKKYSSNIYETLHNIKEIDEEKLQELINISYKNTESISIDYAVLEKSKDIYVIPSNFGWDDVGAWEALDRYREKDEDGNILVGKSKVLYGHNNLIISSNNNVVVEGLTDIYVIENDGKILVGKKSNIANLKELKGLI